MSVRRANDHAGAVQKKRERGRADAQPVKNGEVVGVSKLSTEWGCVMVHYADRLPYSVVLRFEVEDLAALICLDQFLAEYSDRTNTSVLAKTTDGWVKYPSGEYAEIEEVTNGNDQ